MGYETQWKGCPMIPLRRLEPRWIVLLAAGGFMLAACQPSPSIHSGPSPSPTASDSWDEEERPAPSPTPSTGNVQPIITF